MHKIKVTLGNIDKAIEELERYEKQVQKNIEDFLKKLLEEGVDIAKAQIIQLDAVETGEVRDSLKYTLYKEGRNGIIFTDSRHACRVEFGDGIRGAEAPHPNIPVPWAYDSNGHGEDGWYYFDKNQGRIRYTQGMPSRPFMYNTAKELEEKVVDIAREVFSR